MRPVLAALLAHGYALIFGAVLLEQLGVPIPSVPVLLAAGALSKTGHISLILAILLGILACILADLPWYWLGRIRGASVLKMLCRISLEPDSCVRDTQEVFVRRGSSTLIYAKFVPGLGTVAPPLAGIIRMHFGRFLAFDFAGAALWAGGYLLVGWFFGDQLEELASAVAGTGKWLGLIVGGPIAGWLGWKYWQRWSFLRKLRIARIEAGELKGMIDRGESPFIVDLRVRLGDGDEILPGAIHFTPTELDERALEIPFDRDIILYCS